MLACLPERQVLNVDHAGCVLFEHVDSQLLILRIMGMVSPLQGNCQYAAIQKFSWHPHSPEHMQPSLHTCVRRARASAGPIGPPMKSSAAMPHAVARAAACSHNVLCCVA